jgi:uncharacterized protein (TIRG00374 family)
MTQRQRLLLALRAFVWLSLAASLFLLARRLDWPQLRAALAAADLRLLALMVVAGLPGLLCNALRWQALASAVRPVSLLTIVAAQCVSYAASAVLPVRAGEAVRFELLSRSTGMGRAEAAGTVGLDHALNGIVMFAFAAALPTLLPVPRWMLLLIWGGMAAALLLAAVLLRLARAPSSRDRPGRVQQLIARLRGGLVGLRDPRVVVPALLYSAVAWVVEIVTTQIALAAFHLPHDIAHAMAVLFGVNLALAVPAPPANLGSFELGAGMALVAFGGSKEKAAAFAIGLHAVQLVSTLVLGGVFLPYFRRKPLLAEKS